MADVKITKRDYFEQVKAIVEGTEVENKADIITFIDTQIAQLDAKAAKAKAKAEENKTAGDEFRATVKAVLTDTLQTRDEIFAQVGTDEFTIAKVGARLTQLVAAGEAEKEQIKTTDGRKVMAYRKATPVNEVE